MGLQRFGDDWGTKHAPSPLLMCGIYSKIDSLVSFWLYCLKVITNDHSHSIHCIRNLKSDIYYIQTKNFNVNMGKKINFKKIYSHERGFDLYFSNIFSIPDSWCPISVSLVTSISFVICCCHWRVFQHLDKNDRGLVKWLF